MDMAEIRFATYLITLTGCSAEDGSEGREEKR